MGRNIIQGQAGDFQNLNRVEIHAGANRANAHVLALQILHLGDAAVLGHHQMHDLGINGADGREGFHLLAAEVVGALISVAHYVVLGPAQFGFALGDGQDIGLGAAGGLGRDFQTGDLAGEQRGDFTAESIVGACGAAGGEYQIFIRHRGERNGQHSEGQPKSDQFLHVSANLFSCKIVRALPLRERFGNENILQEHQ